MCVFFLICSGVSDKFLEVLAFLHVVSVRDRLLNRNMIPILGISR